MNYELIWVLFLLAAAIYCFSTNKVRNDVVAITLIVAFVVSGTLSLDEALKGFSEPSVILIAALFVIGEGLVRTGVAYKMGELIVNKSANSETKVLVLLMVSVATLGSVMSSTGIVAIFIPVVMTICRKMSIHPSRLMMPLSFAALISGLVTLVATAPNLIINGVLGKNGIKGFRFFDITPIGIIILTLGIIYMFFARKWLAARQDENASKNKIRSAKELIYDYNLQGKTHRTLINANSPAIGKTLVELGLRSKYNIYVLGIERVRKFGQKVIVIPSNTTEMRANDILIINTTDDNSDIKQMCVELSLTELKLTGEYISDQARQLGMAEIIFSPTSELYGKTLLETSIRNNLNVSVIGIRRKGVALEGNLLSEQIQMGDTILVTGDWKAIRHMQTTSDIIVLNLPAEVRDVAPSITQAPHALFSVAVMIALMVSGAVPNVIAAFIGCLLMGYFRCVNMENAYSSIHWPSLILIVGMLPFATALQKTGGIDLAVNGLLGLVGDAGPRVVLLSLFMLCAVTGLFISNTATAVLMAPIAIGVAQSMNASPYPFAMTVALASSAAFMTPVSSPVNTLVMAPGGYKFTDYVKIGVPFTIIVMIVGVLVVPLLFPFYK